MKMSIEIEPSKMAVTTVTTMWAAYHRLVAEEATWQARTATQMVRTWRRMRKKPKREGRRRRERVRKMKLEAAARRM